MLNRGRQTIKRVFSTRSLIRTTNTSKKHFSSLVTISSNNNNNNKISIRSFHAMPSGITSSMLGLMVNATDDDGV
ncbi:hypothetical protein ABK040_014171 [Willaertia magna]